MESEGKTLSTPRILRQAQSAFHGAFANTLGQESLTPEQTRLLGIGYTAGGELQASK